MASLVERRTAFLTHYQDAAYARRYRELVPGSPKALLLIDKLFESPYITVPRATEALGVSPPTARSAIRALVRAGLLEELAGSGWRRVYVARPILEILEG